MSVRDDRKERSEPCREWAERIREATLGETPEGLHEHLAGCERCSAYSEDLRTGAEGLRRLGDAPVSASPEFHSRWVNAVLAERPALRSSILGAALKWRDRLLPELRPALALAPLWILILLFKFSTPASTTPESPRLARSPVVVFQAFIAQPSAYSNLTAIARAPIGVTLPARSRTPQREPGPPGASYHSPVFDVAPVGRLCRSATSRTSDLGLRTSDFSFV